MNKLLQITEEGRGGGALGRIRIMTKALSAFIDTTIVVPGSSLKYQEELKKDGLQYVATGLHPLTRSYLGALRYLIFFLPELFSLIRIIIKIKPDLIHINGSWQFKGLIAGLATRRKVIWHMNDTYQPFLVRCVFRVLSRYSFGFIYASHRTKIYYESLSPSISRNRFTVVIPAPVQTHSISFIERNRIIRKRLISIGYINRHKGLELLIVAASICQDVEIHVVGPVIESQRAYMKELSRYIEELNVTNIKFIGYQDITDVFLAAYDFYICSSIREASPMAVWEAMASGLPIISTDVGDVRNILTNYSCGFVATELTGARLSVAIKEALTLNNMKYVLMSKAARTCAEEMFSIKEVSKLYIRYYTEVFSESSN